MRSQYVIFLGLIFSVGTIISLTFGGAWAGASETAIINSMTVFKDATIAGVWSISVPNVDFFFTGLKSLMMLDFGFFTGVLQIVQWFLFLTIGVGAMWGIYTALIYVVQSALARR